MRERYLMTGAMLVASFIGGAAANIAMTTTVGAQGAAEVVTASQLNVVDPGGNLKAVLAGSDERGLTTLSFYDAAGQVRTMVGTEPDGTPIIRLMDPGGQVRLVATVQGQDAAIIAGPQGSTQGMFGSIQNNPMISLGDGARSRMQIHLTPDGLPRIALSDGTGQETASLAVGSDDMPQLTLSAAGQTRALMTVAQNATLLNLFDASRTRLIVGVGENGFPSVSFYDESGEIVGQLPQ